jgi:purine-nucleoside phosphorylase
MNAINRESMDEAAAAVRAVRPAAKPKLGIILGSGWGEAVSGLSVDAQIPYGQIPHLGKTGVMSHAGQLLFATFGGIELFVFQGRRHVYEGAGWTSVVLPVWILQAFGVQNVLLTNASGGIREDLIPGSFMALEDHINMLGGNPLQGPHDPAFGERFPDQSAVYDPALRAALLDAGAGSSGVYVAAAGPTFETPAEIRAFRALGADVVGMSTVPEAIFANALGLKTAAISCVCNRAAGLGHDRLTGEDVIRTANQSMPDMRRLIENFIESVAR